MIFVYTQFLAKLCACHTTYVKWNDDDESPGAKSVTQVTTIIMIIMIIMMIIVIIYTS